MPRYLRMKNKSASARSGLLAGGNWILDQVKVIDAYPQPEKLAQIQAQHHCTGGAPHNVLLTLAKAGAPFPLLAAGLVGKDAAGDAILADCKQHKVDTKLLTATPKAATSYTDVMSEVRGGRRTFFHYRGAHALWHGEGLDFKKPKIRNFHLGYLLLLDGLDEADPLYGTRAARLLATAQAAGVRTSVDVITEDSDRYRDIVPPALKYTDCLILNELETARITGFKTREPDGKLDTVSLRHAAGALLQLGVKELIVIHFPEGSFARTRKGEDVWQPSVKLPAKAVAGTNGAGDAFAAGFLWGLHEEWPVTRCLETAVALAAACCTDPTTTGGIKSLASCQAMAKKYRYNPPLERTDF